jgi:gamma-glutamylputrescine oxidase
LDNYWFQSAGLTDESINPPLKGRHRADIVIVGGGDVVYYTGVGLSSGNHKPAIAKLRQDHLTTFPQLDGINIEHAWGGILGMSVDVTPSIGKMGDHGNIYY